MPCNVAHFVSYPIKCGKLAVSLNQKTKFKEPLFWILLKFSVRVT